MKLAIGTFNGWRCPSCKKLVSKPRDADMGKCKSCGEEVLFKHPLTKMVEDNMDGVAQAMRDKWQHPIRVDLAEACKKHIHEVNEADKSFADKVSETNNKLMGELRERIRNEGVEIPVKIIKGGDSRGRPVVVNFLNRPILLKTFERIGKEKDLFLSEVVIGFAAKGLKAYLERKRNAETQK